MEQYPSLYLTKVNGRGLVNPHWPVNIRTTPSCILKNIIYNENKKKFVCYKISHAMIFMWNCFEQNWLKKPPSPWYGRMFLC